MLRVGGGARGAIARVAITLTLNGEFDTRSVTETRRRVEPAGDGAFVEESTGGSA